MDDNSLAFFGGEMWHRGLGSVYIGLSLGVTYLSCPQGSLLSSPGLAKGLAGDHLSCGNYHFSHLSPLPVQQVRRVHAPWLPPSPLQWPALTALHTSGGNTMRNLSMASLSTTWSAVRHSVWSNHFAIHIRESICWWGVTVGVKDHLWNSPAVMGGNSLHWARISALTFI